jgi:hypothetical protein
VYSVHHVNYHHKKESWIRKIFCPEQSKSFHFFFFFFLVEMVRICQNINKAPGLV